VVLAALYLALQAAVVRPHLPPAGHGATLTGDPTLAGGGDSRFLVARPPTLRDAPEPVIVSAVAPGSPAERAGLSTGVVVLSLHALLTDRTIDLTAARRGDAVTRIRLWRDAYWAGQRGQVALQVETSGGVQKRAVLDRPSAWHLAWPQLLAWLQVHAGLLLQMLVYVAAGAVLLALRPRERSAKLIIGALAMTAVSAGGALMGSERLLPPGLRQMLTVFAWMSGPIAFPLIALGIEYFPRRSAVLTRYPALHALPLIVAAPMLVLSAGTGLFVAGVDGLAGMAAWDARHPAVFFTSFAAALGVNIAAMVEAVWRYRHNPDLDERRRVAVATITLAIATLAYTIKDGVPALAIALMGTSMTYPWWVTLPLYLVVTLPAVGVTYAVAVHRAMPTRVVVRRSLQYALAQKTLAIAAVLPGLLFVFSLVRQRDRSLTDIVSGQPLFYGGLLAAIVVAIKYRDRARLWLDRRFFRAEYDARAVLLSLASRIPYETDPNELTAMVVHQIDAALHPSMTAVLVAGLEPDALIPVSVQHGSADSLPAGGGIATLMQWSDEPLELYLDDERSAARRLPPDEIEWLRCTGAVLFLPLTTKDGTARRLLGAIVLGEKRSDEPYSPEDRELLSSIAAQVSLGFDVARLRSRETASLATGGVVATAVTSAAMTPLATECPRCQGCHDAGVTTCPRDGELLRMAAVPRMVDSKYRVDHLLGRGGMGAVYRARDMRLERDVAIKVVRADLLSDPDARTRFRREAQLVARLQHPGVVSVFDYGTLPGGAAFLVMEYVRGRDLRAVLREGPRPDAARVAALLAAIAESVDAAHRQGILHRDLKPENILLPDDGVLAKVLDFGVAKVVGGDTSVREETLTAAGQPIGTPAYMAPEQLAGTEVTARTDIFALGVMGYEMLTGELPFGRGPLLDIATRHHKGAPPIPRGDLPGALIDTVMQALSVQPDARPPSARAFALSLT
jgi:predicted Ser/Thr protein kinase